MTDLELHIIQPGQPDRRLPLEPGILQIGRSEDNDVVLADLGVSRRHARLEVTPEGVVVEDLGSGNGTVFRGKRVTRQVVGAGDELSIPPFVLRLARSTVGIAAAQEFTDGRDATIPIQSARPSARLVVTSAHKMGNREFALPPAGCLRIGRSDKNEIVLPEPASSRVHAEVMDSPEGWSIRDNGSSNGTFVNGRKVKSKVLEDGDRVRIGTVELRFEAVAEEKSEGTEAYNEAIIAHREGGPPRPVALPPPPPPPPATTSFDAAAAPPPAPVRQESVHRAAPPPAYAPAHAAEEIQIDPARAKARRAPRTARMAGGFFSRPINQISIGVLAVSAVLICGKLGSSAVSYAVQSMVAIRSAATTGEPRSPATADPASPGEPPPASALDATSRAMVEAGMAEGMQRFAEGMYIDAAAAFYRVLRVDPRNPYARWMGFVACEFITLGEVRAALVSRTTSEAARAEAEALALAAVEQAIAGSIPSADAQALLATALTLSPGDPELVDARARLSTRQAAVARAATTQKAEAMARSLDAMLAQGQSEFERGKYSQAVKSFEAVRAADLSRSTPQYYQAEEGVRAAKDRMKAESKAAWSEANAAMNGGDWVTARERLEQVLRIDPYNESASVKLVEVRKRLRAEASEIYKEARVLEDIQQAEKAIALYQKVIRYVDDENDSLSRKAKDRMDALLR
ncbi:MAG: FHA domain-containing protein [Deltaproteobacteria bacterium]|nr:FHA domain-containing protein [Deltaproteobacteria bacterium]